MPAWFLRRYNQWRQYGIWPLAAQPWRAYAAIHPDFARRLKLHERMAAEGYDPTFSAPWCDARQAHCALLQPGASWAGAWWAQSGAAYALEVRDPTQDKRLTAFTLAVPETQWRGVLDRWLLRRAMAGLLPDAVRLNQRRGLQASDLIQRLRTYPQEMTTALAALQTCGIVDCYLDLAYIRQVYETLLEHQDVATTSQASTILMRGLSAGLFLVHSAGGACRSAHAAARHGDMS
jgi:asparagine synthase (glutamine-hydrolysing)